MECKIFGGANFPHCPVWSMRVKTRLVDHVWCSALRETSQDRPRIEIQISDFPPKSRFGGIKKYQSFGIIDLPGHNFHEIFFSRGE